MGTDLNLGPNGRAGTEVYMAAISLIYVGLNCAAEGQQAVPVLLRWQAAITCRLLPCYQCSCTWPRYPEQKCCSDCMVRTVSNPQSTT